MCLVKLQNSLLFVADKLKITFFTGLCHEIVEKDDCQVHWSHSKLPFLSQRAIRVRSSRLSILDLNYPNFLKIYKYTQKTLFTKVCFLKGIADTRSAIWTRLRSSTHSISHVDRVCLCAVSITGLPA